MTARRLRLGMVGGGEGSFIGGVHRMAARLDDRWALVAGAFASDPVRARRSAEALGVAPERAYDDHETMAEAEAARPDRIDAVAIVTPNHLHVPVAGAFARRGIAVISDKPLATSLAEARTFAVLLERHPVPFVLTHNYTGYPMVREARALVAGGALGPIRVVQVEYPQDWLARDLENTGQKQAAWRTDPTRSGPGGAIGDIGTHAHQLGCWVTGLRVEALLADLATFVPGRRLDDDARMLLRFGGGARGALWCSQVAPGHQNGLRLRVYGEAGSLDWVQEQPNQLRVTALGEATRVLHRGMAGLSPAATAGTRIPAGHPEGYLEGFAQIYADAADLIGTGAARADAPLPGIDDGLAGAAFVEAALRSHGAGGRWTELDA